MGLRRLSVRGPVEGGRLRLSTQAVRQHAQKIDYPVRTFGARVAFYKSAIKKVQYAAEEAASLVAQDVHDVLVAKKSVDHRS